MKKVFNIVKIVSLFFLSINLYANIEYPKTKESLFLKKENDSIVIKGRINFSINDYTPNEVYVFFITLDKVFLSNETTLDGKYRIKVPSEKVFKKNVICVSYFTPFYLLKPDYYIVGTSFSHTKRCELSSDRLMEILYVRPNEDDLVYVEGKVVYFSTDNKFDCKKYPRQFVIDDRKVIKTLCGDTDKKRLILFFQ